MQIISVNRRVKPETLVFSGQTMDSGINKLPTDDTVRITPDGLESDSVVDRRFHGGEFKAIYSYAVEDYNFWRMELNRPDLPYGIFGENLTTQGLDEKAVCIGDRFQFGEAVLQITEPRFPCRTLGMHFKDMGMVKRFLNAGRMGIYYKVIQPGRVKKGDQIQALEKDPDRMPLSELVRLYTQDDLEAMKKMLAVRSLPPKWRETFEEQLAEARGG